MNTWYEKPQTTTNYNIVKDQDFDWRKTHIVSEVIELKYRK